MSDASVSLDLDAKQLYAELQNVTAKFVEFSDKTKNVGIGGAGGGEGVEKFTREVDRATDASGGFFRSNHRVATQIGRLSQELTSGASGIQIFGEALTSAERALNLPLGALGGLVALGVIAVEMGKVISESDRLKASLADLAKPQGNPDFSTLEELKKRLEEILKDAAEARKNIGDGGPISTIKSGTRAGVVGIKEEFDEHPFKALFGHLFGPLGLIKAGIDRGSKENADQLKQAQKLGQENEGQTAAKLETQNRIEAEKQINPRQAELDKITAKFEEKRGPLEKQNELGIDHSRELKALLEAEALEKAAAKHKFDAQERAIALEERLTQIKREGLDVDVKSAQAKFKNAIDTFTAARTPEEKEKAKAKIGETAFEVEHAKQVTAEKERATALEEKLVTIKERGRDVEVESAKAKLDSAQAALDAKHAPDETSKLTEKRDALKQELEHARQVTAERRTQQDIEISKSNLQGREDLSRDEKRSLELRETGRGLRSDLDAENKAHPGVETDHARDLGVELAKNLGAQSEVNEAIDKANEKRAEELASAKATTEEILLRASGDEAGARAAQTRAQYEERIAKALYPGRGEKPNEPLAAEFRKQGEASLIGALAEENIRRRHETPQERLKHDQAEAEKAQEVAFETDRINRALAPEGRTALDQPARPVLTDAERATVDRVRELQQAGQSRADALKNAMKEPDNKGQEQVKVIQETNTILGRIEQNTQGIGANK